jgi:6-phosphogluconolactonase
VELLVAHDAPTAARWGAERLARGVRNAVRRRSVAHLAISGGSTPGLMLAALAEDATVPWPDVHVWQVDERIAPDGDPARNAGLIHLLPVPAGNVHLLPVTAPDVDHELGQMSASLPDPFDLVHLGLGDDGHTASWPPGDPVVDASDLLALVGPYRGHHRATLTPLAVNAARRRLLLVTGADKAPALARWRAGDPALPASRLRRHGLTVIVDADAVGLARPAQVV